MVAKEGSFNRAAEKLSRTQPAITLAVKQLEAFIGLKLIGSTHIGLKLIGFKLTGSEPIGLNVLKLA